MTNCNPQSNSNSNSYRTIVADPPWHYDKAGGYSWREGAPSGETRPMLTYSTMTVDEIAALDVNALAAKDAHLYLWTTQRYLLDAHRIALAWLFEPVKILVWCKPPTGFSMGGTYGNACEFVLFCRRGAQPPDRGRSASCGATDHRPLGSCLAAWGGRRLPYLRGLPPGVVVVPVLQTGPADAPLKQIHDLRRSP